MTYLSRLVLDTQLTEARRDLTRPYELHRTLSRAFPDSDGPHRQSHGILFRVEDPYPAAYPSSSSPPPPLTGAGCLTATPELTALSRLSLRSSKTSGSASGSSPTPSAASLSSVRSTLGVSPWFIPRQARAGPTATSCGSLGKPTGTGSHCPQPKHQTGWRPTSSIPHSGPRGGAPTASRS